MAIIECDFTQNTKRIPNCKMSHVACIKVSKTLSISLNVTFFGLEHSNLLNEICSMQNNFVDLQIADSKWLNIWNSRSVSKMKRVTAIDPNLGSESFYRIHACIMMCSKWLYFSLRFNRINGMDGWMNRWMVGLNRKRFNIPIHRLNRITANLWHYFVNLLAWCGGLSISHFTYHTKIQIERCKCDFYHHPIFIG